MRTLRPSPPTGESVGIKVCSWTRIVAEVRPLRGDLCSGTDRRSSGQVSVNSLILP